jgi:hypothetical protein
MILARTLSICRLGPLQRAPGDLTHLVDQDHPISLGPQIAHRAAKIGGASMMKSFAKHFGKNIAIGLGVDHSEGFGQ